MPNRTTHMKMPLRRCFYGRCLTGACACCKSVAKWPTPPRSCWHIHLDTRTAKTHAPRLSRALAHSHRATRTTTQYPSCQQWHAVVCFAIVTTTTYARPCKESHLGPMPGGTDNPHQTFPTTRATVPITPTTSNTNRRMRHTTSGSISRG